VANALYRLCLAPAPATPLPIAAAAALLRSVPEYDIILVDHVQQTAPGEIALVPRWVQKPDGSIYDLRVDIFIRAMSLNYPSRRGSLFDMAYAALAEQAGTTMWTIDERFYNNARAIGLSFVMHPDRDPLP
jgi:hypothetical protein